MSSLIEPIPVSAGSTAESRFDPCFLTPEAVDDYLRFTTADAADARFSVFSGRPDWADDKARFPLALCEFLAYKSLLAYDRDEVIGPHLKNGNCRGFVEGTYKFFDSTIDGKGDTQGYGFALGDIAFVVMRGSVSLRDWIDDLTATPTTSGWPLVTKKMLEHIGGDIPRRHLGFARAWANVSPQIKTWAAGLPPSVTQFCFSGHSLGGALAILGAREFENWKPGSVAAVVTFAAPRVGGETFRKEYEETLGLKNRTLRLESTEDAVPRVSPYSAVGREWKLDKRPMIGGMEVLWATLLFIAGWTRTKPAPATEVTTSAQPDAQTGATTPAAKPDAQAAKPNAPTDGKNALLILIALLGAFALFLIARRIIIRYRAHGAAKRYALYFTTLSYKQIRDLRIKDRSGTANEDYVRASEDLDRHLSYIRGRDADVYKALKKRPIRALTAKAAKQLDEQTKDDGPYELYVW